MAYRRAATDWISDLPEGIIERILTLLPIRDVVRASILSRAWRYKWVQMSDLNFENQWCSSNPDKLVMVINGCQLLHQGPFRKFSVRTNPLSANIDPWMSFLSRHDVEELQFYFKEYGYNRFPSYLFNCKKLAHLEFSHVKLHLPSTFEGFLNLKRLKLSYKVVDIERLISRSSLLESFTFYDLNGPDQAITISPPKLEYLDLDGRFKDICLENMPSFVVMILSRLHLSSGCSD